jgi:hypothetical protein
MPDPPQGLHWLFMRLCSQMLAPPHGLQELLMRLCSQMHNPPHGLQELLMRLCSQMPDPPQGLQELLWRFYQLKVDLVKLLSVLEPVYNIVFGFYLHIQSLYTVKVYKIVFYLYLHTSFHPFLHRTRLIQIVKNSR